YQQRLDSQMQQQTAGQWWQQQQQPQLFQQQQQPQFAPTAPTLIQHPQYPQLQYPQLQYPQPHHHQITPPAAFSGHHRSQSQHAINPYHYANVPARSFIASASQQIVPQQCSAGDMGAAEPTTPKRQAQESDRLAQIQIAQRQEETRQREESRNNARLIAATEKQRRELLRRNEVAENERQEAARISAAAALERQRRAKRKAELQRDPDRNFHSYLECLEFWPLAKGESQNTYMRSLMANQRMPLDEDTDTAIAVKFAKKHYNWYREYPRDVALCVKEAKEEEEKEKA
ncbi:hypothetical protein T440DRAFT_361613, partial [Plenodomus tracheiphilus IPT5]